MCLLIFKKENATIPYEHLERGDASNPHGCGIAWADGKKIHHAKGAKWDVGNIARMLNKIGNAPAIIHFRWATHGPQNDANTHPFSLPKNWVAAHNGVIPDVETKEDESDSRAFLRQFVAPAVKRNACITNSRLLSFLSERMGEANKMAFLHGSGKYAIANEEKGHWKENVWYSNHSYEPIIAYKNNFSYHGGAALYTPQVKNKYSDWHSYEVGEMMCDSCGREVQNMGFMEKLLIHRRTGSVICGYCAEEEMEVPAVEDTYWDLGG